ncbi:MAG TPA: amino acid adenylation domain-containing protein, partial [Thermoanaerobaculia bacterium]
MTKSAVGSEIRFATLTGMLRARVAERPEQTAFVFLADGETEACRLTYADLDRRARAMAAALRGLVDSGERALLLYPSGLEFVASFLGCLIAGVVAVPAYPPRPNDRSQSRLRAMARDAGPRAVLTTSAILSGRGELCAAVPELAAARWIPTDLVNDSSPEPWTSFPEPDPGALAFLQYTSGSTASPKGVMVTHANLLHNERMIAAAFGMDEDSVVVGWLPLYHDMGLIGNVLQPLHAGARCVLMSPMAFLQRPMRWLEAISRHYATTSGGPNFAYELCLRKAGPEALAGLDLSSWRVAFNGAEPVRAATLERFAETFAPCGFRREAFYPCYGLAEATLFVTGGERGQRPRITTAEAAQPVVSCGHVWMEQKVAIADPETGMELPPGGVGEIWISGPSVARGYWRNPEATERDFKAFLLAPDSCGGGPFLRTGDLGFVASGELYVTGRLKDLIILRGRNHYPQDLELTAEDSHPDLRPGNAAAFSIEIAGEERLVIVLELERRRRQGFEEVAEAVRQAVAAEHEVQVHEVVLIRPGGLPKTSSGKVQRSLCRRLYLAEGLPVVARNALAQADPAPEVALALTRGGLAALDPRERVGMLAAWLRERTAAMLGVPASAVSPAQPLTGLGLDSLTAVELKGSVEAELGVAMPLSDLLQGIGIDRLTDLLLAGLGAAPTADVPPPRALSLAGDQPLSPGQRALWFLERLAPQAGAYNVVVAARAREGLDADALRRTLAALASRHEALRTVIWAADGEPVQRAVTGLEPDMAVEDARAWSEEELRERLEAEAWRPFDLAAGPPLRVRIYERTRGERVLLFAVHHLVSDFWSLALMTRELGVLYLRGDLAPPALQYADFVRWQREMLAGREERLWAYWRGALAGVRDLDLPVDRPRPPVQTYRGGSRTLRLPADLADVARSLAASRGATLHMALLAAFQAQLGRMAGQEDFAVGSPTAGRSVPELSGTVGYFVNPVALRADLAGDPTFEGFLGRVRRTALAGLEHADLPFSVVAERLRPVRDPARPPVFQAMFVLQRGRPQDDPGFAAFALGEEGGRIRLGGLELESVRLAERRAQFDLILRAAELPEGGLLASLEYNADLFDAATAERALTRFRTLLESALAEPGTRIAELPWMDEAERRQMLGWSAGPAAAPPDRPLHELVFEWAERTPEAPAVVAGEETLTYGALAAQARRLAGALRALDVGPETVVGLHAERAPELVAAVLGVLAAGGAWLPLDPALPAERLAAMIEDAAAPMVLATRRLLAGLPATGARIVALEDALGAPAARDLPRVDGHNLTYVIFTSGSTGRPKGVAVPHRAVVNRLLRAVEAFAIGPADAMLQRAPVGFDVSVWETFGPLVAGASVVLPRAGGPRDPAYLAGLIAERRITLANFTPSALDVFLDQPGLAARTASLRHVFVGAEALTRDLAERFAAGIGVLLTNMYGPTEAAVDVVWHRCRPGEEGPSVPIGRPIPGGAAFVLDPLLAPVPAGVPGGLWLGGIALARGYAGRPDLTADAFQPSPFGDGERLYRTGDLARWRLDGSLEFLGRLDQQVKIRGVRVEPGEVEAALRCQPGVREAAVVPVDGPGGTRLAAFVVIPESMPDLSSALREILPEAMIPSAFVALTELPRTPSGKVDRQALTAMAPAAASARGFAAPRTQAEELLVGIWAELLGIERVGVYDDFFELGGHSLMATRLVARISRIFGVELPVGEVFTHPTVAGLAVRLAAASALPTAPPVRPVPRRPGEVLPASYAQRRLWFLDRLEPGSPAYNLPGRLRLTGAPNLRALAAGLVEIARRHEALRTVFRLEAGEPVQATGAAKPELPLVDLGSLPAGMASFERERLAREEAARPFDLGRGPLHRAAIVRLGPKEHELLLTLHHIVADGWSLGVFFSELAVLYEAFAAGRPSPLPALPVQYADYAVWQREWLQGEILETQLAWWRERLVGAPALELPADRLRPAARSGRGGVRATALPAGLPAEVGRLARRESSTPFMVLLAAFQAQLARYTETESVPVGSPVANRGRIETEGLIGFFANMLALRTPVGDDPSFRALLTRVREVCLGAYAHQDLPFERLVEELRPERQLARNPLFQAVFLVEEPLPARSLGGLAVEVRRMQTGTAKFDLTLGIEPGPDAWTAALEYDADLFDPATADRLLGHWRSLLAGIATDPDARVSELPLLSAAEAEQLLAWSGGAAEYPREATIHGLFGEQARQAPDAVALEVGDERISYGELEARADRLARRLLRLGAGLETRVGLCTERSAAFVVGLLGILKAGGAFVPLDPSYPAERLAFMAEDSGLALLVVQEGLAGSPALPQDLETVLLRNDGEPLGEEPGAGAPLSPPAGPGNLAYVMYTSGSTGRPKGVEVPHRGAVRLVRGADYARFGPDEVFLLLAPISFDSVIFEVCGALLNDARLIVFPARVPSLDLLAETIARHRVTTLWLTAGLFHPMVESRPEALRGLTQLLAGGDVLSAPHVRRALAALPGCAVIDGYGPTENATFTTCHAMRHPSAVGEAVPIGRPIANTTVHLLDRGLRPVPMGVPGELYTGGDGLARGYRGRPDLTAERFVPNPFPLSPQRGERLYCTGDLARWRPDGAIDFLGRRDQQVKVRGFRVELGEIEAAFLQHPGIADAAVVVRQETGGKVLAAYGVPREGEALPVDLRDHLRATLPEYMIPTYLVALPELPLNPSGKVDRRTLAERSPLPEGAGNGEPVAPSTPVEERLAEIWREVLGRERIGIHDDFFELGGHSLLAIRALALISQELGINVPLSDLFESPTVAALAERLGSAPATVDVDLSTEGPPPLSFAQWRLWFLDLLEPGSPEYNVPVAIRLIGNLDVEALARALAEIVRRHEPLRTLYAQGEDGEPSQVILPPVPPEGLPLERIDLAALPGLERERALREALRNGAVRPFDLARGPVARFALFELGDREQVLLVAFHHIATDGWSMEVFFRELAVLYGDFAAGRRPSLPEPALRYADWALWQRRALTGEVLRGSLDFWRRRLAGVPPLELPIDQPRPARRGFTGAARRFAVPPGTAEALRSLGRAERATPFMVLLAGFAALLGRASGQDDFAVGVPVSGRDRRGTEGLIGLFVNTLALRLDLAGGLSFRELVRRVRDEAVAAREHQEVPFELLIDELQPERTGDRTPLFQALFSFLSDAGTGPVRLPGLTLSL